jgi:hypothetical protein
MALQSRDLCHQIAVTKDVHRCTVTAGDQVRSEVLTAVAMKVAVYTGVRLPTFQRPVLPASSGPSGAGKLTPVYTAPQPRRRPS